MANVKYSDSLKDNQLDEITALVDAGAGAGLLRIYDGSQPADPDVAVGGQTLLAELTMSDPAFPAASGGVVTASAITSDASANAAGTATWFRIVDSNGNGVVDGDVTTVAAGTGDLQLDTTTIALGQTVNADSLVITGGNA